MLSCQVFQGSPFQVPVQSPGVGIIEEAVKMPPALFQGGGWSQETINGLPAPPKVTVTVKKPEEPVVEQVNEEEASTGEAPGQSEVETPAENGQMPAAEEVVGGAVEKEEVPPSPQAGVEEEAAVAEENAPVAEATAVEERVLAQEGAARMEEPEAGVYRQFAAAARPLMGAAHLPEMGEVMPVMPVGLGYSAGVPASGSYCTQGKQQSPINIEFNIEQRPLPLLLWQVTSGASAQLRTVALTMNGLALSGRCMMLSGASALMPMGGIAYALQSLHLHTASEHAIAGQKFDMELQFLHSAILDGVQKFLVVSVMGRVSQESAPFLAQLAASLPTDLTTPEAVVTLNLADIASQVLGQTEAVRPTATNAQSYYAYAGSFTTAPCTQGVTWVVLKNPLAVSAGDLERMSKYLAQPSRPLRPLLNRVVLTPTGVF